MIEAIVIVWFCFQAILIFALGIRAALSGGLFEDALRKHRRDVWLSMFGNSTWRTFKSRDGKVVERLTKEMAMETEPLATIAKRHGNHLANFKKLHWIMPLGFVGLVVLVIAVSLLQHLFG